MDIYDVQLAFGFVSLSLCSLLSGLLLYSSYEAAMFPTTLEES